jgi:integrase
MVTEDTATYEIRATKLLPTDTPIEDMSADEWASVRAQALPVGFRYVVDDRQEIVEPILLYLYDKCVKSARIKSAGNTQLTYCKDIYEWFSYMAVAGLRWDAITTDDVETYRDRLLAHGRAVSTVRKRLTVILDFYKWARRAKLFSDDIDDTEVQRMPRDFSRAALAHVHTGENLVTVSKILPPAYAADEVNALTVDEVRQVLSLLGPRPGTLGDPRPIRDRVIAELALATGMRVHECVALTLPQILGLSADPTYGNYPLRITVTKGQNNPRTVIVPQTTYADVMSYVETERAAALSLAGRQTNALFVNAENANRNRGGQVTVHTVERNFHAAVMAAGLTRLAMVAGPEGSETKLVAKYTFHDLRHTFAVVYYLELKRQGRVDPWVTLKTLLGHKHLSVTVNTYLRSVSSREAQMTDTISDYMRALRNG